MGPSRRNPHQSSQSPPIACHPMSQRPPTSQSSASLRTQLPPGSNVPTPEERYHYNIKSLQRRDPSIMSTFDQFSYVVVYHHGGQGRSWSKHGYEGTMFLFERNAYPPYGLYILNRVGRDDYVLPLYPEDDIVTDGTFLIVRSYPELRARINARIQAASNGQPLDKFSEHYHIPRIEELGRPKKGQVNSIGLWILGEEQRAAMLQSVRTLHKYVIQNKPYPQELRYGPDRPVPENRYRSRNSTITDSDLSDSQPSQSDNENDAPYHSDAPSASSGELSAVDKLFAKYTTPTPPAGHRKAESDQETKLSVNNLFSLAQGHSSPPTPISPSASSSTGIPLLDTIFASASATSPAASRRPSSIFSPQPSTSTTQVLNQDVLSNLLGLPPSRTPSAASGYSVSAVSHPSSREGDNEDDGESDSPETLLDPEEDMNPAPQTVAGRNVARTAGADLLNTLGLGVPKPGYAKIHGDVTPRPSLSANDASSIRYSAVESITSSSTVRSDKPSSVLTSEVSEPDGKLRANRPLVPFEPDSELWPYSRGPIEEQSPTDKKTRVDDDFEDGEIMELDFAETSVLSDPEAFDRALKNKRSAVSLHSSVGPAQVNGHKQAHSYVNGSPLNGVEDKDKDRVGKAKKIRRSRKERDARDREEIEKSWDIPPRSPASAQISHLDLLLGDPASPSPSASPEPTSALLPLSEMKTPTMNANAVLGSVNGGTVYANGPYSSKDKGKGKAVTTNGRPALSPPKINGHIKYDSNGLNTRTVKESIVAAMEASPTSGGKKHAQKSEFLKEVVTLIHTNKAFADILWQEYQSRSTTAS